MQRTHVSSPSIRLEPGPLRCIVVGMGGITGAMLKFLTQQEWYTTAAMVDIRPQALEEAKAALNLDEGALFTDLGQALANVDANVAIINTPSELHFAQSRAALQAGLHVLVAKPVTNNFEEAVELVELAEAQQLALCVGQQMRYNRHYSAVRRFLESGAMGRPEMVNFLNAKPRPKVLNLAKMDQPALYEMSCHHFDSLMSLFPDVPPQWIMVDGFRPSWSGYAGPCSINGLIRFGDDLHMLYHGGFSSQADQYELRVESAAGALRCRGIHMSNDYMEYEVAPPNGKWTRQPVDEGLPAQSPWLPFFQHWRHYLVHGTLADGSQPPFGGRNNLKVFALLSAGIDSMSRGQGVDVAQNPRYAVAFQA
jgi:predicted dehydrogenase